MRFFSKINVFVILFTIIVIVFALTYLVVAQNPGTNITVCTEAVDQPECYVTGSATPTLNWSVAGTSAQESYRIQIDDDSDFSSPIVDTGEVVSGATSYTVPVSAGLGFETTYYWRIKLKDEFDSWHAGWAQADTSFITFTGECALRVDNMSVTKGNYCSMPSHFFQWRYVDVAEEAEEWFAFQVDDNDDFSSPEVDREYFDLSYPSLSYNNQTVLVVDMPDDEQLGYGITYYWRVKVSNDLGDESEWKEGPSFATEPHRYPAISMDWDPETVDVDEPVDFTDTTIVYGGATKASWFWTFEDSNPATSVVQNPTVQFTDRGDKTIGLTVTDSDDCACTLTGSPSATVTIQDSSAPGWREVSPW